MAKIPLQFNLQISFLKEGKRFIAYSPALDLSTSGKTLEEAGKHFTEASAIFFEELVRTGTVADVLGELGWQKEKKEWRSPMIVSQSSETIRVPARA